MKPDNAWGSRITAAAGTQLAAPYSYPTVNHVPNGTWLLRIEKLFTPRRASSNTRRRTIRVSPIVDDSRLLPPVGVRPVSQCLCWRSSANSAYPSLPRYALTTPSS